MRGTFVFVGVLILSIAFFVPDARAAAQLAAGAKTSARPTATNPQLRQMQITFDPDVELPVAHPDVPNYSVTSFQLSVSYDPDLVSFNNLFFAPPFQQTPGSIFSNDPITGIVSNISGTASAASVPPGQDVDIFAINFTLNPLTTFDDPLTFTIFASPIKSDFIAGTDPTTNQTIQTDAAGVEPTTIIVSFNQATAITAPLPKSAYAGFATLAALAAGYALRCRRAC